MRLAFILLQIGLASAHALGQTCATPPPTPEQYAFARDVLSRMDVQAMRNAGTTCIPLQAHIVRQVDGTGGPTQLALNLEIANLNRVFQPAGIEFFWKAAPNTVNNADYFTYDQTAPDSDTEAGLVALFTTATNAVNVYFVGYIKRSDGTVAGGYAYFPANTASSNRVFLRTDQLNYAEAGIFAHEFGHYFNLFHTFEGTVNGPAHANAENVPRTGPQSNCLTRGDLLCDTQADPGVDDALEVDCVYIGNEVDINNVPYVPPLDNPMSYWSAICAVGFENDQNTRIAQGLATRLAHNTYSLNAAPQSVLAASGLSATWGGGGSVALTWTDNAANDLGYLIERSSTSASAGFSALSFGATAASGTGFVDADLASNTTYWYRVKAVNGDCNTYSNVATVSVGLAYCTPLYFQNCSGGVNAIIDRFRLVGTTIIDNNNSNCSPNGFGDFTAQSANITAGVPNAVVVDAIVGAGSYVPTYAQIWIDLDQDGSFEDAGEKMLATAGTMSDAFNGSITVPVTALNGTTRLRVRCWDQANACDPTSCSECAFGETEEYTVVISGGVSPGVQLNVKALLQGPYNGALMWDSLRVNNLIPLQEPDTAMGYVHIGGGGGETTNAGQLSTTGVNAVIDWVVIELRNAATPATVVASRSALLRANGTITTATGGSPLAFSVPSVSYHIAVRHRNHLGVMTSAPVGLSSTPVTVDFSLPATPTYGTEARATQGAAALMWAGNVNGDNTLLYTGGGNDRDVILSTIGGVVATNIVQGYNVADANCDGDVKYTGGGNDRDLILQNIGGVVPTNPRPQQLP